MSINDLVVEMISQAKRFGFVEKWERHEVGNVTRKAYRYAESHKYLDPIDHAKTVSAQYMAAEIDKWHRRGYKRACNTSYPNKKEDKHG